MRRAKADRGAVPVLAGDQPALRVGFVIDRIFAPRGGTERQVLNLLGGLGREGVEPHLVCLRSTEWLEQADLPYPVHVLGVGRMAGPGLLGALKRCASLCRRERFDVVQTFFRDANIVGTLGGRLARTPVVMSSRRNIGYWLQHRNLMILRLLRRFTDHYLANSDAARRAAMADERIVGERTSVIFNGIDDRFFEVSGLAVRAEQRRAWGASAGTLVVGCVANLRAVKNIETLIDAAARLEAIRDDTLFVVVGEGPHRTALEARIRARGLEKRFLLHGASSDVRGALAAFDIAVLASSSESLSNSICEYMAAALPVVATNVGGTPEVVESGVSGFLFPLGEDEALAGHLSDLIDDERLRRRLGERARATAERCFDSRRMVLLHAELYRHLVERSPRRVDS